MLATEETFLKGISPVVTFGKCFGVVPYNVLRIKGKKLERLKRVNNVIYMGITLFLIIDLGLLVQYNILHFEQFSPVRKLDGLDDISYFGSTVFVYLYHAFRHTHLQTVISHLTMRNGDLIQYTHSPVSRFFPRKCYIILVLMLLCGIWEEAFYYGSNSRALWEEQNNSTWQIIEVYYIGNFPHWQFHCLTRNPVMAIPLSILLPLATLGWEIADVICIVFFLALRENLCVLVNIIKDVCQQSHHRNQRIDGRFWEIYRDEYLKIVDSCNTVQNYSGPIVVACYVGVINEVIVDLLEWVGPISETTAEGAVLKFLNVGFPFLHYCARVISVTYFAGEVYQKNEEILRWIHCVPDSAYDAMSLERLEQTITNSPAGIRLFGAFMITRKTFVVIVSFITTTEIFLLQTFSRL